MSPEVVFELYECALFLEISFRRGMGAIRRAECELPLTTVQGDRLRLAYEGLGISLNKIARMQEICSEMKKLCDQPPGLVDRNE